MLVNIRSTLLKQRTMVCSAELPPICLTVSTLHGQQMEQTRERYFTETKNLALQMCVVWWTLQTMQFPQNICSMPLTVKHRSMSTKEWAIQN